MDILNDLVLHNLNVETTLDTWPHRHQPLQLTQIDVFSSHFFKAAAARNET